MTAASLVLLGLALLSCVGCAWLSRFADRSSSCYTTHAPFPFAPLGRCVLGPKWLGADSTLITAGSSLQGVVEAGVLGDNGAALGAALAGNPGFSWVSGPVASPSALPLTFNTMGPGDGDKVLFSLSQKAGTGVYLVATGVGATGKLGTALAADLPVTDPAVSGMAVSGGRGVVVGTEGSVDIFEVSEAVGADLVPKAPRYLGSAFLGDQPNSTFPVTSMTAPVLINDVALLSAKDMLFAVNLTDGAVIWRHAVPGQAGPISLLQDNTGMFAMGSSVFVFPMLFWNKALLPGLCEVPLAVIPGKPPGAAIRTPVAWMKKEDPFAEQALFVTMGLTVTRINWTPGWTPDYKGVRHQPRVAWTFAMPAVYLGWLALPSERPASNRLAIAVAGNQTVLVTGEDRMRVASIHADSGFLAWSLWESARLPARAGNGTTAGAPPETNVASVAPSASTLYARSGSCEAAGSLAVVDQSSGDGPTACAGLAVRVTAGPAGVTVSSELTLRNLSAWFDTYHFSLTSPNRTGVDAKVSAMTTPVTPSSSGMVLPWSVDLAGNGTSVEVKVTTADGRLCASYPVPVTPSPNPTPTPSHTPTTQPSPQPSSSAAPPANSNKSVWARHKALLIGAGTGGLIVVVAVLAFFISKARHRAPKYKLDEVQAPTAYKKL
jgi:hypothetical protein